MSYDKRVTYAESGTTGAPISEKRITYLESSEKEGTVKLVQTIDKVEIKNVGVIGGLNTGFTVADVKKLEHDGMAAGVLEAQKRGITQSIDSLAIRDILPDIDFRDVNNNAIGKREWRQPWSGSYSTNSGSVAMYLTNTSVNYERKIFTMWGVRYVNTGPGRTGGITDMSSIIIKDSAQNIIDIWDIEDLDTANALYAYKPLVFNNSKALRLEVTPKANSSGNFDNVKILGKVVEAIGDQVGGMR